MENVIEVSQLAFAYASQPVLQQVGFSVARGDFAAIIGSNGSGKSTLLKLLLGFLHPDAGKIRLMGQDIGSFRDWPKIGYVPQNINVSGNGFPATAQEVVQANLFSKIGLMRFPKKSHREKTMEALGLVGMEAYAKRMIGELSGGQQQRVMLARVLVSDPEIVFLDEPTTGVDAESTLSLYELLRRLNHERGLTILMVTHDVERVSAYANRIFCLEETSLVELEQRQLEDELAHKHKHPRTGCCAAGREGV
jgi:zinc transport system ATP-binding protein